MDAQAAIDTYVELMRQITSRRNILIDIVENHRKYPSWAVAEFSNLQVRMICETIAMACLIAHGDVAGTRSARLSSAYQADYIINALEKLHPYFYPRPTIQKVVNGRAIGWDDAPDANFLSKEALLKSYHASADYLHLGDLRDIAARKQKLFKPEDTVDFLNKTTILLRHHNIFLADDPDPPELFRLTPDGVPVPRRQIVAGIATGNRVFAHMFSRFDFIGPPSPNP